MAQQIINIGSTEEDRTGDGIRVGGNKINENFTELYGRPNLGQTILMVGSGGPYQTLEQAVAAAGTRWIASKQMPNYTGPWPDKASFTADFTNGSATFTKTAGQNFQGTAGLVGQEFILVDGKYYRVKDTISTTSGTLFGTFKGTTGSYTCTPLLLDWITIMLLPGSHGSYAAALQPGTVLSGFSKETTSLVEDSSGTPIVMSPMTKIVNLSLEPNILFGSMDNLGYTDALIAGDATDTYPYGCEARIDKCKIVNANERGPHAGGDIKWPCMAGGLFAFTNSELGFGNNTGSLAGGGEAGVTTRLLFENITTRWFKGSGNPLWAGVINDGYNALVGPTQIDVVNCYSDMEDFGFNPTSGPLSMFYISDANSTLNISGGFHRIANNNSSAAASEFPAVVACLAGTVNVQGGAVLEATGSTVSGANQGTGIYNAGGTVNVRAGCRVKGDTNKAINNAAGTVNVSPNADTIGGTTGVINAVAT